MQKRAVFHLCTRTHTNAQFYAKSRDYAVLHKEGMKYLFFAKYFVLNKSNEHPGGHPSFVDTYESRLPEALGEPLWQTPGSGSLPLSIIFSRQLQYYLGRPS